MTKTPTPPSAPDADGEPTDEQKEALLEAVKAALEAEEARLAALPNSGMGTIALERSMKDGAIAKLTAECRRWGERVEAVVAAPKGADPNGVNSGRWRFDYAKNTHRIQVQDDVAELMEWPVDTEAQREHAIAFAETVLRHESYHARITHRDTRILRESVERFGIGSLLFNLFEDARIEDEGRYREGVPFDWWRFYPEPTEGIDNPIVLFQYFTMAEDEDARREQVRAFWTGAPTVEWRGKEWDTVSIIERFNDVARTARTTRHLWAPLREWLEVFGGYEEPPPEMMPMPMGLAKMPGEGDGEGEGEGDGEGEGEGEGDGKKGKPKETGSGGHGYGGLYDPAAEMEAIRRTLPKPPKAGSLEKGPATEKVSTDPGLRPFKESGGGPDLSTALELERKLRRMVEMVDSSRTRTSMSGTRLHMPNVLNHSSDAFRQVLSRKGVRRICLLMDMSGSMGSSFQEHGGAFLQAMLGLHRRGLIHADIWLSGGGACYKLPPTTNTATVMSLGARLGCESIDATLSKAHADVIAADTVLIYTDGHLTDGDVKAGEWRGRGVDLIGVAAGRVEEDVDRYLRQHFHKGFSERTGSELAARIVQYILQHP